MLEGAHANGQENKAQFKRDLDQGMNRAKEEARAKKDELASDGDTRRRPVAVPARPAVDGLDDRL